MNKAGIFLRWKRAKADEKVNSTLNVKRSKAEVDQVVSSHTHCKTNYMKVKFLVGTQVDFWQYIQNIF